MKAFFLILVLLHGLIHLLGFVKAYHIREVKNLSEPISRAMGLLWLLAALSFLLYGILTLTGFPYDWVIGLLAVLLSQVLIIRFWKDAKYGSLPNVIILVVVLFNYGAFTFTRMVATETAEVISLPVQPSPTPFSEGELVNLPVPIQRWLKKSGALGKDKLYLGKVEQQAMMKLKPDQQEWYLATALQYTTINPPAFIWTVEMGMNPLLTIKGRDKFIHGKGDMLITFNALINMVNEHGPKLDEGSLQRYLGEMVWFPSLAVSPFITWESIDDQSATATLTYEGTSGSGTFYFNHDGDFVRFSALRFMGNESEAKRYEWVLDVIDYAVFEGIRVPSKMKATWRLDEGDWTWLELEIKEIRYNEHAAQ